MYPHLLCRVAHEMLLCELQNLELGYTYKENICRKAGVVSWDALAPSPDPQHESFLGSLCGPACGVCDPGGSPMTYKGAGAMTLSVTWSSSCPPPTTQARPREMETLSHPLLPLQVFSSPLGISWTQGTRPSLPPHLTAQIL